MVTVGIDVVERIHDGDIGALICALIPVAIVSWLILRVYILPARRWKTPEGRKERTHFYRKKQAAAEKEPSEPGAKTRST